MDRQAGTDTQTDTDRQTDRQTTEDRRPHRRERVSIENDKRFVVICTSIRREWWNL